jgi:hypothetical protein
MLAFHFPECVECMIEVLDRQDQQQDSLGMAEMTTPPSKAVAEDILGRFREVISDPLNLLIERVPMAGVVQGNEVYLHNGNRVPVFGPAAYYGPFSQLLIINRGVHEPLEEFVFQDVLKTMPDAPQMIELGAYWAHYSMWLKKVRMQAKVIMVEPDPNNLAAGRSNCGRNGIGGEFIQALVAPGHWQLDMFLGSRGIERLDILHVDIQGHEGELIAGARNSLTNWRMDYLLISTHSQEIHRRIVAELTTFGYRIEVASDYDSETTSYDGLVFASSPRSRQIFRSFSHSGRTKISTSPPDVLIQAILNNATASAGR